MVNKWLVIAKENTYKKRLRTVVSANTEEKARQYAIGIFHKQGYSNFHILSCTKTNCYY